MRLIDADAYVKYCDEKWIPLNVDAVNAQPTIEERKTGRWGRLMMYLADLQLTYSPNWGANGCGDEKLYDFVTWLIEELGGWEDGGEA